ncbi:MAG: DMT family transporter [Candidatus Magasanikbacteria bacterium]|nr:DMT family transporter [Candidatus Magasanikbacteria bacterium]
MNFIGYLFALGAAVAWGMVYTLDQKIMDKVSPLSLLFFSYIVSALIVLPLMFFEKGSFQSIINSGKNNLGLLLFSTFLTILASFLILSSVKILHAPTASVIEISYPLFVALFAFLLYNETITWRFALGALLVFSGTAIIIRFR